ncbi:MAG: hypothetical protein P8J20_00475 [Novosphingobium sp.]|nr:hypothetical protein [Novosphingobium sp.]
MSKPAKFLLVGLAFSACFPALAQAEDNKAADIARKLDDPLTQYVVAGVLAAVTKQVLEARVEPFVRAIESAGVGVAVPQVVPETTVGDLAGLKVERLPKQIMQRVPKLMDSLAGMASAYGDMLPELEGMAKRLKDAVPSH